MNKSNGIEKVKVADVIDGYGVVINQLYEGDKIVTQSQDEYKRNYIINFKKKEAFVKVYTNPITALFKELPTKEFAVAMAIMPFISYKDGILRHEGKIVTIKIISDILCENYDGFKKVFSSLIKKEVVKKVERQSDTNLSKTKQCYVVNPYIFLRGADIEKKIVEQFKGSKWANI